MFGLFKRLFSATEVKPVDAMPTVEPVHYNGYIIFVMPIEEAGQYRVAGIIEKTIEKEPIELSINENENENENRVENLKHTFIRSDLCMNKQQAEQITLQKCKLFIDQVGDDMFK